MKETKYTTIDKLVEHGLETINPDETIEIKLKDLILIFKFFEELNRFFHQRMHYPNVEDVHKFMEKGGYPLIHKIYYKILTDYIPKEIMENWGEENDPFDNPDFPYYYKPKDED